MATQRKNKEVVGMQDVAHAKDFQARAFVIANTLANVWHAGNTITTLPAPLCHNAVVMRFVVCAVKKSQICTTNAFTSGSACVRNVQYLDDTAGKGVC